MTRTLGAALALSVFGIAFAAAALGTSLIVFDDHPGQLYRLWHVVMLGPAPWAWNTGWWAGYPELQFYPPAYAYLGAGLQRASLGTLSVAAAYQVLLWVTYLLPGATVFAALARLTRDGWLALPGAFVALTLSAGVASGVEGGVRIGMAPSRLGWALLPLLLLALRRWVETGARFPVATAVPLVAVLALTHPAHLPAAVVLVVLAAVASRPSPRRLATALAALALAAALTAFWTLPLLVRVQETRALAWGKLDGGRGLLAHPLLPVLVLLALAAWWLKPQRSAGVATLWPWAAAALVLVDALVVERIGLHWLPADRVADGAWLAVVLAAGVTLARLVAEAAARFGPRWFWAVAAVAALAALSLPGRTLALWPRAAEWPTYEATVRGLRLDALWAALRAAPPGRVLFVRSAVPLVYSTDWWRPHSHLLALTPIATGRGIINGTFTHPSPIAALVYRGAAGPGAITSLVERLDGHSLFGRPLESLDASTLARLADRLGVSVVVALDEDAPRLAALDDGAVFARQPAVGPFRVWTRRDPATVPRATGGDRWEVTLDPRGRDWVSARVAYYPLWRAEAGGVVLPVRRGDLGDLEVRPSGPATVELRYAPGVPEVAGLAVSLAALVAWLITFRAPVFRGAARASRSRS